MLVDDLRQANEQYHEQRHNLIWVVRREVHCRELQQAARANAAVNPSYSPMIMARSSPGRGPVTARRTRRRSLVRIAVLLLGEFTRSQRDGPLGRHLSRMSFLTDFTPATPRATWTALSISA